MKGSSAGSPPGSSALEAELLGTLSPRQRDVVELLVKGLTNREIGSALGVAPSTVKSHVAAILALLQVDNRTELAGLVQPLLCGEDTRGADGQFPDDLQRFSRRPAVAVVPFETRNGAEDTDLGRGLADDIINLLSRWRWFPVIARSSTFAPREGTSADAGGIARELNARYVLHGSVRGEGERLRLRVFLDDAERHLNVWSERYDVPRGDVFDLEDALSEAIVGAAYSELIEAEMRQAVFTRTSELSAWDLTHRALWHLDRRSREDNRQAHALVTRALERDQTFIPALFVRGIALFNDMLNVWSTDVPAIRSGLHRTADEALALRPDVALGHLLRARAVMAEGDMAGAAENAERAADLNPSFASAHALLGQLWVTEGRQAEGLDRLRHAARLSPRAYVAGLAIAHVAAGEYEAGLTAARAALRDRPDYLFARILACASLVLLGETASARAESQALGPAFRLSSLRRLYRHFETGDKILDALRRIGVPE